jgi:hypothetical protein
MVTAPLADGSHFALPLCPPPQNNVSPPFDSNPGTLMPGGASRPIAGMLGRSPIHVEPGSLDVRKRISRAGGRQMAPRHEVARIIYGRSNPKPAIDAHKRCAIDGCEQLTMLHPQGNIFLTPSSWRCRPIVYLRTSTRVGASLSSAAARMSAIGRSSAVCSKSPSSEDVVG